MGTYHLTAQALQDLQEVMPLETIAGVIDKIKRSAHCTHPQGNRRFHDFVFQVNGNQVEKIARFQVGVYKNSNTKCPHCGGSGKAKQYDDFEKATVDVPCSCLQ